MVCVQPVTGNFPGELANRDQNGTERNSPPVGAGFRENGITTMEQVNAGMRVARRQESTIPAITGQFVAWCREEHPVIARTAKRQRAG
ncbi:replication protein P [Klebsiella pneumoniae]|uniref:replication protein P n=1 Tax=Klebsiella pneumoniae TaxID=573 RepID=UPI00388D0C6D